jgi:hypothetical protein
MPATGRDVHVDVPLSNVAIGYTPRGFIADQIAPVVPVQKQSDGYYIWSQADAFRVDDDLRAPGTEANVITRSVSSATYFAINYALKDRIPYEDIENADANFIITKRGNRAKFIKSKLMLSMEKRVALKCTSGSNVGSYSTVASAWTDYTTAKSAPIADINTGIRNVEDATGYKPNSIIFGRYAWRHFREHADVIGRIYGNVDKGMTARIVTIEQVKALFEVDRVLIGGAYYSTAEEGQAAALAQLWNDNVLVYYAPMTPAGPEQEEPSFMYSFRWEKIMNMNAFVYDLPRAKAEEVELGYYQDEKITASTLGFLITGVGSSQ